MKPATFLRTAAVLTLIHSILHTIGGVLGSLMPSGAEQAIGAMKASHFMVMGSARTYWDFYRGLGFGVTVFLTADAIIFWLLASLMATEGARLRPIIFLFALAYAALAVNSYQFFFLAPVINEALIVLCLVLAMLAAKKDRVPDNT